MPYPNLLRAWLTFLATFALLCACGEAPRAHKVHKRLLIVGWDGATWRTLDPLLEQGRLPNLARLIGRGTSARLESTAVPISSAAWAGAVTGRQPGESGVYGFFEPVQGTSEVRLISSLSIQATPLWRILTRNKRKSVVFGVPVTWPPEPIAGVMVGGMLSPEDGAYTWPTGLAKRYRERGFVPDLGIWRTERTPDGQEFARDNALKRELLLELMVQEDWDMFFVVFKNLDNLAHHVFTSPDAPPLVALCLELDRILGDLVQSAGQETNVILLSDHGFHAYPETFYPHAWLFEAGFAVRAPAKGPGAASRGPLDERWAREHTRLLAELDLQRTRAYVGLCEGNFGGIRIHLRGREVGGSVEPDQVEPLLEEIEAALQELKTPAGEKLVVRTWRGRDLYPGPHQDLVSDLIFETVPDVNVSHALEPKLFQQWPGKAPDHDRTGILVMAGPNVAGIAARQDARIFDLAPTACALLGLPVYEEMDGVPLLPFMEGVAPPRVVPDASQAQKGELDWMRRALKTHASPEVESRLRSLGYTR